MTVTSIKEIHDGRDGDDEVSKAGAPRRYTRVFRVTTNDNYDTARHVLAAAPSLGAMYPYDPRAWLRKRAARNESFSKRVWLVTCAYSSEKELEENPLSDPAVITWDGELYQRIYVQDKDGNAILNSAGDPFDPPVMGDESQWTVNVTKNLGAVPIAILGYQNKVNSSAFALDGVTVAARAAKLNRIHIGGWQERNSIYYREVTLTLAVKMDLFDKVELDAGFRCLIDDPFGSPGDQLLIKITDDDGDPVRHPTLLDGTGEKLADPTPATANWLTFKIYKEADFSLLPIR